MNKICSCGIGIIGKNGIICKKCHETKKKKEEAISICKICSNEFIVKRKKHLMHLKKGYTCRACRSIISSRTMKETRAKETKEDRIKRAKYGNSLINKSMAVTNQWKSIRADAEKYKSMCDKRLNDQKKYWDNVSDEIKNERVRALLKSHGKRRSISSDLLKQKMIDHGVYDGFVSEEPFHGFIPDEINHNLRLIVEMFGDVYHCNPNRFTDPNLYIKTIDRTVGEQWKRDERRLGCFYKHGYKVIIVWDSDFRKKPNEEIQRIRQIIEERKNGNLSVDR